MPWNYLQFNISQSQCSVIIYNLTLANHNALELFTIQFGTQTGLTCNSKSTNEVPVHVVIKSITTADFALDETILTVTTHLPAVILDNYQCLLRCFNQSK